MSYAIAIKVADLVRDSGGRIVGRTRLQKLAYLFHAAGLEEGLNFSYKHYGPFSEELAAAAREASLLGLVREEEQLAAWGGAYSTYTCEVGAERNGLAARRQLADVAAAADAVELELAATAVFLALEGVPDPWNETARRKPAKADGGRLQRSMALYRQLRQIETPRQLPDLN